MPMSAPPAMDRGSTRLSTYMAPIRQPHPSRYGRAESRTMNWRVGPGKWYTPSTLKKKQAANTSDCVRENQNRMVGVCIRMGRNGNTPPHAPAAFTARKAA